MLAINDVSRYLNISERTVYRLIKSGALPAKHVGRQWRFEQSDLYRFSSAKPPILSLPRPAMMTVNKVCEFLHLSRWTVYRLIKDGKLSAKKSGGQWTFPGQVVLEFLTHNRDVSFHVRGMDSENDILKMNQVAQLLGVTPRMIYTLVKEGKLPASKVGGRWRFIL